MFALAMATTPDLYSTRKGHAPPGWSDDAWKSVAPTIPGAYKPKDANGKAGRWTLVPRRAFEAWQAAQHGAPPPAPANDADDEGWTPAKALASVGLRRTR